MTDAEAQAALDSLTKRAYRELESAALSGDRLRFVVAYVAVILYVPLVKQRAESKPDKPDLFDCDYLPTNKFHHRLPIQRAIKPVSYIHPPSDCMTDNIERDRWKYRNKKLLLENSFLAGFTIHDLEPHLLAIKKRGNSATLIMHAWLMVTIYQWRNPNKPLGDVFEILARNNIQMVDQNKTSIHWTKHNWRKIYNDAVKLIAGDETLSKHAHWIELQTQAERQAAQQTKQLDGAKRYETVKPRRLFKMPEGKKMKLGQKRVLHQTSKDFERKVAKLLPKVQSGNFDAVIEMQQDIIRTFSI